MSLKPILPLFIALMVSCSEKPTDITVSIVPQPVSISQTEGESPIKSIKTKENKGLGEEEYIMTVKRGRVTIEGGSQAGIFYGKQTLKQLENQNDGKVPNLTVQDKPQFGYRGMHLDCCRHFYTVEDTKQFIDMMAAHKLNRLHWHLTEDDGWRFESKKYPKLTEIGAWRDGSEIGFDMESSDGIRHGGFYTQEEMKDIVAYAAERFITIIPEIEMPGHSGAALASYPYLGCTGGPYEVRTGWGVYHDIMCVGKDSTIQFLKDILDEVCEIFPSEYIHIGGDEAPKDRWKNCPDCQARMKAEGLENEAQLQSWLNQQIEEYLNSKGRKIIGWDEILEGGISKTATVMSWRGIEGGQAAAAMGNDAIMSPHIYLYFDYNQSDDPNENQGYKMGSNTLERVYSYDPYEGLDDKAKAHIKGVQANMWTEFTPTWNDVMHQVIPRVAALAEVAWNPSGRTDYKTFVQRVKTALVPIYETEGWKYAPYVFDK